MLGKGFFHIATSTAGQALIRKQGFSYSRPPSPSPFPRSATLHKGRGARRSLASSPHHSLLSSPVERSGTGEELEVGADFRERFLPSRNWRSRTGSSKQCCDLFSITIKGQCVPICRCLRDRIIGYPIIYTV